MNIKVSHHLLLCATSKKSSCCNHELGESSWKYLKKLIKELDLENIKRPEGIVLRSKVDCLRVCEGGPVLLIWPDGIWYGGVNPEKIESIVYQHIIEGNLISDWVIKKTPLSKYL